MKKILSFTLLTLILLSSCSKIPALAAPTSTPLPTDTPQPTASPTPAPTQTSTPTATPDLKATAAAHATLAARDVMSDVEKVLGEEDIPYEGRHTIYPSYL